MGEVERVAVEIAAVDDRVEAPIRFLKVDTQGSEWHSLQGARRCMEESPQMGLLIEFWPYALRGTEPEQLLRHLTDQGFTLGKATAAPYPMGVERILRQARSRDPVRGGIDLYGTRGLPFHVGDLGRRLRSLARRIRED